MDHFKIYLDISNGIVNVNYDYMPLNIGVTFSGRVSGFLHTSRGPPSYKSNFLEYSVEHDSNK